MAKTNYATDSYSSLAGLAAVAYNDPDYFREVKNQIFQQSPTKDLDINLPSTLISGLFGQGNQVRDIISNALEDLSLEPSDAKDWIDVNKDKLGGLEKWSKNLASKIEVELLSNLDNNQEYYKSLEDYVTSSLDLIPPQLVPIFSKKISSFLRSNLSVGDDLDSMIAVVNNNPLTKIDSVPPDTLLPLSDSVNLGFDPNGVSIEAGYLNFADYFNNIPYPKMTGDVSNLPSELSTSIKNGYVNYPPYSLEALFNPSMAETLPSGDGMTMPNTINEILKKNESLFSEDDKSVYSISLMALDLAGFTSYDPAKNSNGDFLDIASLPKYSENNPDPDGGNLFSARGKGTAFS